MKRKKLTIKHARKIIPYVVFPYKKDIGEPKRIAYKSIWFMILSAFFFMFLLRYKGLKEFWWQIIFYSIDKL